MAITVDQANIGTMASTGVTASNKATTAIVVSGAMIVALTFTFTTGGATASHTMSGGGLTWTRAHTSSTGTIRISLHYAFAPIGLASGTTLTHTSASNSDHTWAMASYLGVDTGTTFSAFNNGTGPGAPWASGSVAGNSGDALIGGAAGDGTLRTSTTDAPGNERIDFNSATSGGSITLADKLSIAGTDTLDGDFDGALTYLGIGVSFIPAASDPTNVAFVNRIPAVGSSAFAPGLRGPGTDTVGIF